MYGGVASCTNNGYDTYGKTSVSWNTGLSSYLDPFNSGTQILDGTRTGGGITIIHEDIDDMPYNEESISFTASVISNVGNVEVVELYYNLGDGMINLEMNQTNENNYEATINGLYDGMIIEYYIQAVNSEGELQTYPSNAPDLSLIHI